MPHGNWCGLRMDGGWGWPRRWLVGVRGPEDSQRGVPPPSARRVKIGLWRSWVGLEPARTNYSKAQRTKMRSVMPGDKGGKRDEASEPAMRPRRAKRRARSGGAAARGGGGGRDGARAPAMRSKRRQRGGWVAGAMWNRPNRATRSRRKPRSDCQGARGHNATRRGGKRSGRYCASVRG